MTEQIMDMARSLGHMDGGQEEALEALLELDGRQVTDAVVDEVFANFCVGK